MISDHCYNIIAIFVTPRPGKQEDYREVVNRRPIPLAEAEERMVGLLSYGICAQIEMVK